MPILKINFDFLSKNKLQNLKKKRKVKYKLIKQQMCLYIFNTLIMPNDNSTYHCGYLVITS